jgi:hypothetical protein
MADGYLFGQKLDAQRGASSGQYLIIGRVKSVVYGQFVPGTTLLQEGYNTPADIGKIRYEPLYSALPVSISNNISKAAYPINSFIKQYPLVGEIVVMITGPSPKLNKKSDEQQLYYFPPFALWNSVHQNAFPNMYEYRDYLQKSLAKPTYAGNADTGSAQQFPLGTTFVEKENVRNLKIFEGDTVLESRYGQSIRFGSTVPSQKKESPWSNAGNGGDPIVIIRNGQGTPVDPDKFSYTIENINRDKSSIYLTAGQEVVLEDINNFPLSSFGTGIDPQVERFNSIPVKPISNEIVSAADQDKKTQGN